MYTLETLETFFGWCSVINIGILLVSTLTVIVFRTFMLDIHSKLFNLDDVSLSKAYLQYLGQYKIVTFVFCIAPYFALKLMGS